jgi:hypothetical protein
MINHGQHARINSIQSYTIVLEWDTGIWIQVVW